MKSLKQVWAAAQRPPKKGKPMFLLEKHRSLPAYTPGDHEEGDGFIRLNTNESPYPPSPGVKAAIVGEVGKLGYYNDPDCAALRKATDSSG